MTATQINKSISYQTDTKGRKTAIVFDLKNKNIRGLVEDMVDLLTVKERQNDETVDFFEAANKILNTRKK